MFLLCVCKQEFARLLKENFPTIDGAILLQRVHLFQMTISKTHTVNLAGLHNAMQQLNVLNAPSFALHYFVVPHDAYPLFANPTPVAAAIPTFPNNAHMIVLEMPLPEVAGYKRKVSEGTRFTPLDSPGYESIVELQLLWSDSVLSTCCGMLCRLPHQRLLQ